MNKKTPTAEKNADGGKHRNSKKEFHACEVA